MKTRQYKNAMSRESLEQLVDRWMNEAAFREEMRADPKGAVKRAGLELDESEWAALGDIDWDLPDEHLQPRVMKMA